MRENHFQASSLPGTGPATKDWELSLLGTVPQMVEQACSAVPVDHKLPASEAQIVPELLHSPAVPMGQPDLVFVWAQLDLWAIAGQRGVQLVGYCCARW